MKKLIIISLGVALAGWAPQGIAQSSAAYIGNVFSTAANFCPRGTMKADGRILPIQNHQALYSILGTTYGGDGRTTFKLPDLRPAATSTTTSPINPPNPGSFIDLGLNTGTSSNDRSKLTTCVVTDGVYPSRP